MVVIHFGVLRYSTLGAIPQVAFQHLGKHFVSNRLLLHHSRLFAKNGGGSSKIKSQGSSCFWDQRYQKWSSLISHRRSAPSLRMAALPHGRTPLQPCLRAPTGQGRPSPSSYRASSPGPCTEAPAFKGLPETCNSRSLEAPSKKHTCTCLHTCGTQR